MKTRRFVWGHGPRDADIALVGEAPGKTEHVRRVPFCGKSGAILDTNLRHAGLWRQELWVTNVYKCWLGRDAAGNDLTPTQEQVLSHAPLLEDELSEVKPRIVGSIGRLSTRYFLGDVSMDAVHGIPHSVELSYGKVIVVPIVHPAAGMRKDLHAVWSYWDTLQLGLVSRGKLRPVALDTPHYRFERVTKGLNMVGGRGMVVAVDTEGHKDAPFCSSHAVHADLATVVEAPARINLVPGSIVVMHYAVHDIPVLRRMGVNIDDSSIEIGDTMILAYVLGVEPRGLKDLARRHLHADMHDYKDVVGPYYAKAAVRYVARANKVDWGKPEERVVFDPKTRRSRIYRPQALNLRFAAILRSHRSSANVDYEKRWLSIPADLRAKVEDRFGPHPAWSNAISLVPVDERTRYAGTDAVVTRVLWDILWDRVRAMGLDGVARTDMSIVRMIERMERVGVPCDASALKALIPSYRAVQRSIERKVSLTYARSRPINLGSGPQVASLLYGILKLRAPRKTRRGDRGSTDKKSLEALRSEHPVIDDIRCWRIADKNRSFAEKLPNHVRDGRIHGRIKYTSVVSGRFAMEDPNLQQIPTRNEGSKEIRNAFSAPDGRLLMSNDYDQLEMKVLAHYSKDKTLLRYMRSGQDVHVKTAALLFGTDEQRVTKAQRTVTKNINYGLIYQIQEQGLHDQLKVAGVQGYSVEDCAKLIKQWFRIYPGVESFFEECRVEARRYAYVRSEWGRIRWLPNIYSPIEYMRAEAERKAISHKISATATDIIKRAMARYWTWLNEEIWPEGWYMEVVLQIHDELLTEMDAALSSEANAVRKIMMGDSNRFAVPITVGCAIGKRWGELK